MITLQMSFIDRNTAETWTVTHEFETLFDVTEYLMEHPPENTIVRDTFLVDVRVNEGENLYFKGFQGAWELINRSDYEHTWMYEYKQAVESKQRMDQLRSEGKVKMAEAPTPELQEKLDHIRQRHQDEPRRRKERYSVR